jgi:predicted RNA-binding protein with RPS1 domain
MPSSVEEVEVGRVLPGAVQAVRQYGAFVRPMWGLDRATVLVPTRFLANFFIEAPEDVLDVGQTLFVRQMAIEEKWNIISRGMNAWDICLARYSNAAFLFR